MSERFGYWIQEAKDIDYSLLTWKLILELNIRQIFGIEYPCQNAPDLYTQTSHFNKYLLTRCIGKIYVRSLSYIIRKGISPPKGELSIQIFPL